MIRMTRSTSFVAAIFCWRLTSTSWSLPARSSTCRTCQSFFYGLSVSNVRERPVEWYYSVPEEKRPVPPPTRRYSEPPAGWALLGLIPAGVGVAYILFYAIEGRKIRQNGAQE